ncbi:MAG: dephospho-CoA kinase [Alistipes sp.]|jgi:dephospho-CoA kinase|nr:dephospho-CoA kinase [Alistipes sp.]
MRVGVTGGIGSGKSTVCESFAELGVPVYDSDARARELMNNDVGVRREIVALLGAGAYLESEFGGEFLGRLNSAFVAAKVFEDRALLASLNAIVHPAVAKDFEVWAAAFSDRPYVVFESAILFESGFDRFADLIVTVSASVELRIERVLARGRGIGGVSRDAEGISREEVMRRMANQMSDAEREARADFVVDNNGGMAELVSQVQRLDGQLRRG